MAPIGITIRLHKCPSTINEDGRVLDFHPEQNYWKLKEEYLRKGELFTDPYFKASSESLGYNELGRFISRSPNITWKRPKDIYKHGTPRFINDGMTQHDVIQQDLNDCWYMAAAASLTFHPNLLERVVPPDQSFAEEEYAGIFHFQFWQYGRWVDVVVDDLLPVVNGQLKFADHNDDFWMPLLEKAFANPIWGMDWDWNGTGWNGCYHMDFAADAAGMEAFHFSKSVAKVWLVNGLGNPSGIGGKIHAITPVPFRSILIPACARIRLNGSYEAIGGGWINEGFVHFTGGIGELIYPLHERSDLFETIEMALKRKSLLGAGTLGRKDITAKGVWDSHAYSITGTYKLNIDGKKTRLMRLRNPWGKIEWKGRWSDSSEMWFKLEPELQKKLNENKNDGEFWMDVDDFKDTFGFVEICHLSANTLKKEGSHYSWKSTSYHGRWIKGANGDDNQWDTYNIWNNPRYLVSLGKPDEAEGDPKNYNCPLIVSLIQKNWRKGNSQEKKQPHLHFHIYMVLKKEPKEPLQNLTTNQIKELVFPKDLASIIGDINYKTGIFQLPPGHYVIIPFLESPQREAEFMLRIFTETKHESWELDDEISADEKTLNVGTPPQTGVNQVMDTTFLHYAGQDKKIGTAEFKNFMNTYTSGQELKTDGFSMEDCQKIIQHFDESGTDKLTQDAFKQCFAKIDEWAHIFIEYDVDDSGIMTAYKIRDALKAAGFHLNSETIKVLLDKFSNTFRQICFDKFVTCLVLLESVFRKVKSWPTRNLPEKTWLELIESS